MKKNKFYIRSLLLSIALVIVFISAGTYSENKFLTYTVDCKKQDLKLYYKNEKNQNFNSIGNLKFWLEEKNLKLEFAMNGGMYKKDFSPQGLYIENKRILSPLDTLKGNGNFYLKPNGVFYLTTQNIPKICKTELFHNNQKIKYATQSGPMLLVDGQIHPEFKERSPNLNIRNGVGILPNGKVVFVLSKEEVNFYDFASYFKKLGCKNALYLDGFVSRAYLPSKHWVQTDGNFGVLFAVTTK
ncbi:phosphodiester glycosidase family protein [Flavobacterium ajazii]|uniref:phosphodiester glycosidase family protein n=1 Tax=Flavobacterium ajazii TaxID=2692318 RepID=UPI001FEA7824|nr:phosphodiester glycosidase family protein [Flavobacterium ajazii]